jgi:hypothetical protein
MLATRSGLAERVASCRCRTLVSTFCLPDCGACLPASFQVPLMGVSTFTGSTKAFTISPVAGLVLMRWRAREAPMNATPTLPMPDDWRAVYQMIGGASMPSNVDYFARNFALDGATALAARAVDSLVWGAVSLGTQFVMKAFPMGSIEAVVRPWPRASLLAGNLLATRI